MRDVEVYQDVESLVEASIEQAAELIETEGLRKVAISGGSAGVKIAAGLIKNLDSKNLLDQVTFYLADERFVEAGDPQSNFGQVKALLDGQSPNFFLFDLPAASSIEESVIEANKKLGDGFSFDLALMGCGPDGHTASLFPGHEYPKQTVVAELESPKPPSQRISFSYEVFLASSHVWFAASGEDKATAVSQALSGNKSLPAGLIQGAVSTKWFITEELA